MRQARSKVPRSMIMTLGGLAMLVLVALGAWAWLNRYAAEASPETIVDAAMAHKRARAGEIPDFTGISSPYEEPEAAELTVDTESQLDACSTEVFNYIVGATRR